MAIICGKVYKIGRSRNDQKSKIMRRIFHQQNGALTIIADSSIMGISSKGILKERRHKTNGHCAQFLLLVEN